MKEYTEISFRETDNANLMLFTLTIQNAKSK